MESAVFVCLQEQILFLLGQIAVDLYVLTFEQQGLVQIHYQIGYFGQDLVFSSRSTCFGGEFGIQEQLAWRVVLYFDILAIR